MSFSPEGGHPVCIFQSQPLTVSWGQRELEKMTGQKVTCPRCGSTNVKQIGAHRESLAVTNGTGSSGKGTTRYAYQCQCGMAFTRAVQENGPPLPGSGSI